MAEVRDISRQPKSQIFSVGLDKTLEFSVDMHHSVGLPSETRALIDCVESR